MYKGEDAFDDQIMLVDVNVKMTFGYRGPASKITFFL